MTYLVTARKWRPQIAEDVVGQTHITTTLRNAIATNRLSHAYLFSGPRGVGKTTTARILAKAINCLHPRENNPDNTCELCCEITDGRSVNVFEIDGASNRGVDEIRNLRESVRYAPAKGKYKVYIIDEVHMLTKEAFNALLKTLEEPPPYVVFIFATTEIHKVPATILSRCQRFDFRRIPVQEIIGRLRFIAQNEQIVIDDNALMIIAKRADGSLRDAQSIFDQIVSFCGVTINAEKIIGMLNIVEQEIFFRVTEIIRSKDTKGGIELIDEIVNRGVDAREFLNGLIEHFRNILIVVTLESTDLLEISDHYKIQYRENAKAFSELDLLRFIKVVADTESAIKWAQQPRFKLEICLMQLIMMDRSIQLGELLAQIEELKKKAADGPHQPGTANRQISGGQNQPAPIRGAVKASQPVLRPDQIVHPPIFSLTDELTSRPAKPAIKLTGEIQPDPAAISLTREEVFQKWPDLVAEACRQRIAVGSILSETSLVEVQGNQLRVACPDDFHLDALKRNKQFLADLARSLFGAKIRLETILGTVSQPRISLSDKKTEPSISLQQQGDPQHYPVIDALVREFGAKKIE
jgi:DNA polymerase-3 subunit gamma/tau